MATGMQQQTGARRTGTAMRTGAAQPAAGGAGGVGNILQKWNELDPKLKTIIMVVGGILVISLVILNVMASSNKPVPLYSSPITTTDSAAIQQYLTQWGIPHEIPEGGTNVAVAPKYRSQVLIRLASVGLPKRSIGGTTADTLSGKTDGITPPTREEKKERMTLRLAGDLTEIIREIDGVADCYVKLVPKPENSWGENKSSATAAIMIKFQPGAQLSADQINGIVNLTAYSVPDLAPENIKIMDTKGNILNNTTPDPNGGGMLSLNGGGTVSGAGSVYDQQRVKLEQEMRGKVQSALDQMLGSGKSTVQLSLEMDFSQKETNITKYGGATSDGTVVDSQKTESEEYTSDPESGNGTGAQQMSNGSSGNSDYKKQAIVVHKKVDEKKIRTVNVAPSIKRITCSVSVDGLKDQEAVGKIEKFVKDSIGFNAARGDSVTVIDFNFIRQDLIKGMEGQSANAMPFIPSEREGSAGSNMNQWMPVMVAVPVIMVVMLVGLFYIKQKSVQKEKQRLVLTSGPGATVSDISDLLADKEGKITPPPATKVNTTDQLENLAKEKPTKVAELLKSTWLADR